jgi:hypothetical protein
MDVYGVRERAEDAARLAIVHVPSHSRQRHNVVTLITFASVSMILPLQNGHAVGLDTGSLNGDSRIRDAGSFSTVRLFKSEQHSPVGPPRRDVQYVTATNTAEVPECPLSRGARLAPCYPAASPSVHARTARDAVWERD